MTIEAERVVDGPLGIVRARGPSTLVEVVDFVRSEPFTREADALDWLGRHA